MESIRELYRIGYGPSSSHTMAPRKAAEMFKQRYPAAVSYRVTLFGSLAATGKGHLTDRAVLAACAPIPVHIIWQPDQVLPFHPNGMQFEAIFADGSASKPWQVYSIGGGALAEDTDTPRPQIYAMRSFTELVAYCEQHGLAVWEYVEECEGKDIWPFLREIWHAMQAAMDRGLNAEGVLPGGLGMPRKALSFYRRAMMTAQPSQRLGLISAYALAVNEENASGGQVVTAPTCGSSGTLPAAFRYVQETYPHCSEDSILRALATAGFIGNLVKHNASISGAQVGCQGEVGTACAMAAGGVTQLLGGTVRQVEYAAAMALEHHLGLTCDPVAGLVQIPCIERNAFAASRALSCAEYALFTDGTHRIPFDDVVIALWETGNALPSLYRETANGGLATVYRRRMDK
jgi:L-serine dehydratase